MLVDLYFDLSKPTITKTSYCRKNPRPQSHYVIHEPALRLTAVHSHLALTLEATPQRLDFPFTYMESTKTQTQPSNLFCGDISRFCIDAFLQSDNHVPTQKAKIRHAGIILSIGFTTISTNRKTVMSSSILANRPRQPGERRPPCTSHSTTSAAASEQSCPALPSSGSAGPESP